VVIETGAYDQPAPGRLNFWGYYYGLNLVSKGWDHYLQFIQNNISAPQGSNLHNTVGGIPLKEYPWRPISLLGGYWDYDGDFTNYLLNNICQSTACN
jgi:hypothetical protein